MNMLKKVVCVVALFHYSYTYTGVHLVTNTNDSGPGSLRQAIIDANADGTTPRVINFSIGVGVQTIQPLTALPALTASNILIDGSSQPGWAAGSPVIILDGTSSAFSFDGITINGTNNCTIQDLVINNGFNSGITITGNANNNAVYGCFVGTDETGTVAAPNSLGIMVSAAAGQVNNNTIIGAPGRGNIFSGNAGLFGAGMFLSGNLNNMVVQGNFVGTDSTGTAAIPNAQAGAAIISQPSSTAVLCSGALIGGPNAGEGNIFSGNTTGPGLFMGFQNIENTTIQGNKFGVDITGTVAVPNGVGLITFTDIATTINGTIFGGSNAGEGNIVSANPGGGLGFQVNCNDSVIRGNFIGTDITGTVALGNGGGGLSIQGSNNIIGGSTAGDRNIISNNGGNGIYIGQDSSNNTVQGNYIGVDSTGAVAMGNTNNGVEITGYDFGTQTAIPSNNNIIGGSLVGERNIISNSGSSGILINLGCNDTVVKNNYIGVDVTGTVNFGNANTGVQVQGYDYTNHIAVPSNGTIIGGATEEGNIISGNGNSGIQLNLAINDTIIRGNKIGVDVTGTVTISNLQQGILINGYDFGTQTSFACNNTIIGGSATGQGNIISGNTSAGIQLNLAVNNTIIRGNKIGVDTTGLIAIPNQQQGIYMSGFDFSPPGVPAQCNNTIIGGTTASERNTISANLNVGIQANSGVNNTLILGNYIGVGADGATALGNTNPGIYFSGNAQATCENTTIGGTATGAGNIIAANTGDGILLQNNVNNSIIQGNYIGTNAASSLVLGNGSFGIRINGDTTQSCNGTVIGGSSPAAANIIGNNTVDGIWLQTNVNNSLIQGNFIGTDATATIDLGNGDDGIQISGINGGACTNNLIGGTASAQANTIKFNTFFGVNVGGDATTPDILNPLLGNPIYLNGNSGIVLHDGGNDLQEAPTLLAAEYCGANNVLIVTVTAPTTPAASFFRIELFFNSVDRNPVTEGERLIGVIDSLATSATVTQAFAVSGISVGQWVSATATNLNNTGNTPGNTSEFSLNTQIQAAIPPAATLVGPASPICAGSNAELTLTVVGNGPYTIIWSDGVTQTGVNSPVVRTVNPLVTTHYSATVTDAYGCSSMSNVVVVNVNQLPTITLTASSVSVLPGSSIILTATPSGNGPFTLTWSDGVIETNVTGTVTRTVTITAPITYSVTATDANGCVSIPAKVQIFIGEISPIVRAILKKYCLLSLES